MKEKMKKVKLIFLMVAGLLLLAGGQALAADPVSADTFTVTILENAKGAVSASQTQDGEYTNPCTLEPIQEEGVDKGQGRCYFKVTPEPGWELYDLYEKNGELFDLAYSTHKIADEGDSAIYSGHVVTPKDVTLYPVFKNTETGEFAYVEGTAPEVPANIKLQTAENKVGSALLAHNDYTVDLNDQVFYPEIFFKNTHAYQNTCNFSVKIKALEGYRFYDLVMDQTIEYGTGVISSMGKPVTLADGSVVYDAFIDVQNIESYSMDGVLKLYPIFRNIETGELVYCGETPGKPDQIAWVNTTVAENACGWFGMRENEHEEYWTKGQLIAWNDGMSGEKKLMFNFGVRPEEGYSFYKLETDVKTNIELFPYPKDEENNLEIFGCFTTYPIEQTIENIIYYPIFKNDITGELVYPEGYPGKENPNPPQEPQEPQEPTETDTKVIKTESTNPKTGIQEEMLWGAVAALTVAALVVVARKQLVRKK